MKNAFVNLVLVFIIAGQTPVSAQPYFDLTTGLRKYWKTRGRLVGDPYNRDIYNGFICQNN